MCIRDSVMSVAAFHWVPDHVALFATLAEAMRPGAQLVSDLSLIHISEPTRPY